LVLYSQYYFRHIFFINIYLLKMKWFFSFLLLVVMLFPLRSDITEVGTAIDHYNGVAVYFNGNQFTNVIGRNTTNDGYNLGLKFQCVEFVKRYYYQIYDHKMPNSYGHAKDLFDKSLNDKAYNVKRGLMQYRNVREYRPKKDDILVYDAHEGNPYGHVAIISKVTDNEVEIVQQNMGKTTRKTIALVNFETYWTIADYNVLGWLRKEN